MALVAFRVLRTFAVGGLLVVLAATVACKEAQPTIGDPVVAFVDFRQFLADGDVAGVTGLATAAYVDERDLTDRAQLELLASVVPSTFVIDASVVGDTWARLELEADSGDLPATGIAILLLKEDGWKVAAEQWAINFPGPPSPLPLARPSHQSSSRGPRDVVYSWDFLVLTAAGILPVC